MNKYSESKIYKIVSSKTNLIYIGSTTNSLFNRFKSHLRSYNNDALTTTARKLFDIDVNSCSIELLQTFPCNNRRELQLQEGKFIKLFQQYVVNKKIEGRSQAEYKSEHKQEIADYQRNYKLHHKDDLKRNLRKYYMKNREAIIEKSKLYYRNKKSNLI
jgi:hypothetical protein